LHEPAVEGAELITVPFDKMPAMSCPAAQRVLTSGHTPTARHAART